MQKKTQPADVGTMPADLPADISGDYSDQSSAQRSADYKSTPSGRKYPHATKVVNNKSEKVGAGIRQVDNDIYRSKYAKKLELMRKLAADNVAKNVAKNASKNTVSADSKQNATESFVSFKDFCFLSENNELDK